MNVSLQRLDFDDNGIADEGARALAGVLEANNSLQELVLDVNQITESRKKDNQRWRGR